ncbi:MAG: FAD-dependent oxidoreductase [Pseudomonadota bacterium]
MIPLAQASLLGQVEVAIVGGGGCGMTAALAAAEAGAETLVLERDASPLGTTAMSTGLIPAAGTRFQQAAGIDDTPEVFAADVLGKAQQQTDPDIALALAQASAATVHWLVDAHDVPLTLVDSFRYPGHTHMRMHGTPNRTGRELMGALANAVGRLEVPVLCEARVADLIIAEDDRIAGVRIARPDGSTEDLGCGALVLACCGFGGNAEMVAEYIPEIAGGVFHGHPGNTGDAVRWGLELGAQVLDMTGYQGHGGLAKDHGVPILWPVIMQGGVQVNAQGERFSNEARGYSEQAVDVLRQPGGFAWTVYDQARHELMLEFDDYRDAIEAGALRQHDTIAGLAAQLSVPVDGLAATAAAVDALREDPAPDTFGRSFAGTQPFAGPYYAVKVTGALFHTQGGLRVDAVGQVQRADGRTLPNLFAGGGAARGISGPGAWGYLAGNGLLTATTFGRLAGTAAAQVARSA